MNAMKNLVATSGLALLILSAMVPAFGQGATSALQGHNSDAPVDFAADRIEVQDRSDRVVLSGDVVVTQGALRLAAPRLTVAYSDTRGIQVQRLDASGGVTITSPSERASGQFAIYDLNNRLITLLGGVTLTRGESQVRGARLVLDLDSGRAIIDGNAAGGSSAPGAVTREGGRVTGTFTVPQRDD